MRAFLMEKPRSDMKYLAPDQQKKPQPLLFPVDATQSTQMTETSPDSTNELLKQCCICGGKLPPSEFYKNKGSRDGLDSRCRNCVKQAVRDSRQRKSTSLKRCTRCGEWLDKSKFQKNKTMLDGLQRWCAKCNSEYDLKRRKGIDAAMKQRKFNAIFNGLSSSSKNVYEVTPIAEAWSGTQIIAEMKRQGKVAERSYIMGCLSSLVRSKLVTEPKPGLFQRVPIESTQQLDEKTDIDPISNALNQGAEMQKDTTTNNSQATDPIEKIGQLASQCQAIITAVQQLASSIETVAIEVQESFTAQNENVKKMHQLQQLLKSLG